VEHQVVIPDGQGYGRRFARHLKPDVNRPLCWARTLLGEQWVWSGGGAQILVFVVAQDIRAALVVC